MIELTLKKSSRFDRVWVPRLGEHGSRVLRRSGQLTSRVWPQVGILVSAGAVALSFGNSSGAAIAGVLFFAACVVGARFLWGGHELAEALTGWFGLRIAKEDLPPMHPKALDEWCEDRGLSHSVGTALEAEEIVPR